MVFDIFFGILIADPKNGFCMGYSLCKIVSFLQDLVFSRAGFLDRTTLMFLYNYFSHVLGIFQFLIQTDHFAKAIAFAWAIAFGIWPTLKIVSFLEYISF